MRPSIIDLFRNSIKRPAFSTGRPIVVRPPKAKSVTKKKIKVIKKTPREALFDRQNGKCAYCPKLFAKPKDGTLDHVLPKSLGGKRNMANLVLACQECNAYKGHISTGAKARSVAEVFIAIAKKLEDSGYL